MSPRVDADAPSVVVSRLGSSAVGISWPTSARKLAVPMPATPGPNQASALASSFVSSAPVVRAGLRVGLHHRVICSSPIRTERSGALDKTTRGERLK